MLTTLKATSLQVSHRTMAWCARASKRWRRHSTDASTTRLATSALLFASSIARTADSAVVGRQGSASSVSSAISCEGRRRRGLSPGASQRTEREGLFPYF